MNDKIKEQAREIPVVCKADVAVLGGGCTGVFAAVRAARLGMKVVLVEKQNCFGGMATAGAVHVWHQLTDTTGEKKIIGGLTTEVLERLKRREAVVEDDDFQIPFRLNTEELKVELDELIKENEVVPFLHTIYAAPVRDENGSIQAVLVENKDGRQAIKAEVFVDATGDGDLARDLDIPSHPQQSLQPPTTCAKIYDMPSVNEFDWQAAVREHGDEFGLDSDWGWGASIPGLPGVEMRADTHIFETDVSKAGELTDAEMEGRRKVRAIMDIIRKYHPGRCCIALADLAASIGIRETHRIKAKYTLTGEDVLYGRRFEDAIANGSYRVDIHHSDGAGITFRYLDGTEEVIPERGKEPQRGRWREDIEKEPTFYQIPFRSLVPECPGNLVLAGRMLDADPTAFSAVRVMVNLNQTGEAAGTAAALAVQKGLNIGEVDPKLLRKTLAESGSVIL